MKEIKLTQGQVAQVSDHRFDELNQYLWYARYDPKMKSFYAMRNVRVSTGKQKTVLMHRLIAGAPDGMPVDHIDHQTLNNQDENLRICTPSQNAQNQRRDNNTSGYKGFDFYKVLGKWRARIRGVDLGYFDSAEEAARAYDKKAKELFGEFAHINF